MAAKHYETAFHAYEQAWKLPPQDDQIGVWAAGVAFVFKDSGLAKGVLAALAKSPRPEVRMEAASMAAELEELDEIKGKLASARGALAAPCKTCGERKPYPLYRRAREAKGSGSQHHIAIVHPDLGERRPA